MVVSISKSIIDLYAQAKKDPLLTVNVTLGYIDFKQASMICKAMFQENAEKVSVDFPDTLVAEAKNLFSPQLDITEIFSILLITGFVMGVYE